MDEFASREAITALVEAGALLAAERDVAQSDLERPTRPLPVRLVVCVTGAVSAMLMPAQIIQLRRSVSSLHVVVTPAASKFVRPEALRYLGCDVSQSIWNGEPTGTIAHVELAESADAIVVMPASASAIARIATGICTDLASLAIATTSSPVVVAPSMHPSMWANAAVQRNVHLLREDGIYVVEPRYGTELGGEMAGTTQFGALGITAVELTRLVGTLLGLTEECGAST